MIYTRIRKCIVRKFSLAHCRVCSLSFLSDICSTNLSSTREINGKDQLKGEENNTSNCLHTQILSAYTFSHNQHLPIRHTSAPASQFCALSCPQFELNGKELITQIRQIITSKHIYNTSEQYAMIA